jgi:hypothetical protein
MVLLEVKLGENRLSQGESSNKILCTKDFFKVSNPVEKMNKVCKFFCYKWYVIIVKKPYIVFA